MQNIHTHGQGRFTNVHDESFTSLRTRAPRYFAALSSTPIAENGPYLRTSGRSNLMETQHLQESNREYNSVTALREYVSLVL